MLSSRCFLSLVAFILTALLLPSLAQAQWTVYNTVYRPPDATYRVLSDDKVDLIYEAGTEADALRMRRAVQRTWAGTDSLVGSTPQRLRMPVVVNGFNDRSNGFVTPLPFKQENEAPTRRTPQLSGRASSWPTLVATHELVHGIHAEVNPGLGWGRVVRWFAPDAARATNLTAPRGLIEGIAVYRESTFEDDAGRLNAPRFQMKMRAAMLSDDPWSLTQMMERPAYTQPFNRFYIGGSFAFAHWMASDSTASFFHKASALHNRLPFLGYGIGLWAGLGEPPNTLRDSLRSAFRQSYQAALDARRPLTQPTVIAAETGRNHRRPYWLNDSTLVAFVDGYDVRPGFYRIDARTGDRDLLRVQTLPEDRMYSLTPDTSALLASRYVPDRWSARQWIAEVERIDLSTGAADRLSAHGRAFAPWQHPDGTVGAFRTDGSNTHWAEIGAEGAVHPVRRFVGTRFRQAALQPGTDTLAVLVNVEGTTTVHRATRPRPGVHRMRPWFALRDGFIYDLSWGPDGRYLLFSADVDGVSNILALDTRTNRVLQLTNVAFGAMEPALSPDRATLAFVTYQHEQHDLVRMPFRPDDAAALAPHRVLWADALDSLAPLEMQPPDSLPNAKPYRAWKYLTPRAVYPTVRYDTDELDQPDAPSIETLGVGVGLGLAGADPLQRWAYQGTAYWQNGRLWGEGRIETARWRLRPSLSVALEPSTLPFATTGGTTGRVGLEERSVALGLRTPVTLQSNAYQTVAQVALQSEVRQTRFFGDVANALDASNPDAGLREWRTRQTVTPSALLAYRLQQNRRDLVPNTGVVLRSIAELDTYTDGIAESRALIGEAFAYLPVALRTHTGVRLDAALITQNRGSIFNLDRTVPRGYEDDVLSAGTFVRLGAEVVQPLAYPDDGLTLFPFYVKALYTYGFGQTLGRLQDGFGGPLRSSVGGGVGLQMRWFYLLDLDLRVGVTYRLEPGDAELTFR